MYSTAISRRSCWRPRLTTACRNSTNSLGASLQRRAQELRLLRLGHPGRHQHRLDSGVSLHRAATASISSA